MSETRILLVTNRDLTMGADEPPLRVLGSGDVEYDPEDTSTAAVAEAVVRTLAMAPGVRVSHRSVVHPSEILAAVGDHRPEVVFNLCESLEGDSRLEVTAAWLLERLDFSFTGSPSFALRQCLYKLEASRTLARAGVPVPATVRVDSPDQVPDVAFPVIVKPDREDGSTGIGRRSVVKTRRRLREQVAEVVETCKQPAVVQQYIEGRELAVSLLGWPVPRVLPIREITFGKLPKGHPRILTYASKWFPETKEWMATPSTDAVLRPHDLRRVTAVGRRAFQVLGLRDYGRVDVRLDDDGNPYVIDVNPNCDVSPDGGFVRAATRAGMSYAEVLWEILRGAIRRRAEGAAPFAGRGRAPRIFARRAAALLES